MRIEDIQAIDVHGHYGAYLDGKPLQNRFLTAGPEEVVRLARKARTRFTIVSPMTALYPSFKGDAVAGNKEAAKVTEEHAELLQWVVIHPLQQETFAQADEMLDKPNCVGIKIHPELHNYPITKYGDQIFRFAAERKAVVLTHSGQENSVPGDFVTFADRFSKMKLILAHLGFGWDGDHSHQVKAILRSTNGNMFTDTSSICSIYPNLIEWAVGQIGADRILFGTDTPLYAATMQRARIDYADINDEEKRLILCDNAIRQLGL